MTAQTVRYEEKQTFPQFWFWFTLGASLLVVGLAFGPLYLAGQPVPAEALLASAVIIGAMMLVVAALLFGMKLLLTVDGERIHVRFTPFVDRSIPLHEVRSWEVRTYQPILEYGGWGLRKSLTGRGRAYNARGNRGVQLELSDGELVLLGSQRAEELAEAIRQSKQQQPG